MRTEAWPYGGDISLAKKRLKAEINLGAVFKPAGCRLLGSKLAT